ncbi:hypothetical protein [Kitasatospora sp. NPDC017646]|uniref:hypothetical protein n=1 Tax=Kitasatospora sp. NPDC017646 TaxID=3364024 RepID=UPI00378BEBDA
MTVHTDAPSFWLSLPDGFTAIDLSEDPGDRMCRIVDGLHALADVSAEQKLGITIAAESALQAQLREGAVHVSNCLVPTDEGTIAQGVLALFLRQEELEPRGTYPQRAAQQLTAAWPDAEVAVLDFTPGRAAVVARDLSVPVPGALHGPPGSGAMTVRQLEVLIPHPWSPHVLAAVFTTRNLDHWEGWLPVVGAAIGGISFYPPRNEALDDRPPEQWDNIRKAFG